MFRQTTIALLIAVLFTGGATHSAQPAAELEQGFQAPPNSARPAVYWWWLFNRVDKKGITRDLEEFRAKGIGQVNLICTGGYAGNHPMPGVEFLGPEWRELFRHALREAARLKIDVGFNMAGGWVMMGPWVAQDDAMKNIVQSELKLKGPQKFSGNLPQPNTVDGYYRDVMVQAFRSREKNAAIAPKDVVDITDRWRADQNFQWDVPEGEWTILRTGFTLTGSKWYPYPMGDTFPGGAGYQIDCMNTTSLKNHFNNLAGIALQETKNAGGKLAYLWSDSWESGTLTWTQDFAAQFRKFRGYDPAPYLPAMSGYTVGSPEVTSRFRADFDRTIADCVAENFYGEFARLCHANGVEMGSEAAGPGFCPPFDSLRNLGRCDVPAGEFWVSGHFGAPGGWNSSPGLRVNLKQTASAAHIYGKRIAQAEAFTQQEADRTHWSLGPGDLKPYGDNAFCEGINYFMLHQATCQLSTDGRPGYEFCAGQHWNPSITWWDQSAAYFAYLARCQYLLQQGLFVGDVCHFLGEEPSLAAPQKQYDPALRGYDGDYCNADVLLKRMSVNHRRIALPNGMSYRLLTLPNASAGMSLEVLQKIGQLVCDGATVVGPKPEKAIGLKNYPKCDEEVQRLAAEIWGDCDGKARTEHVYGKGRVVWGKTPGDVLRADGVKPDFVYGESKTIPALAWIWHAADGDNPPAGQRTFKMEVSIPSNRRIVAARIGLTADNAFELTVNGTVVCRGDDWKKLVDATLTKHLVVGRNTLLVRATNGIPGPAGLFVMGEITLDQGKPIPLHSQGSSWVSSENGENWSPVRVVGNYGCAPWGDACHLAPVALDFIHRKVGNADIYFLANRTNQPQSHGCVFRVLGKQPEIWHPVSGEIRDAAAFRQADGCTELPLEFAPFESYFVVFRKSIDANFGGKSQRNFPKLSSVQEIAGPWTVKFDPKWGGPESVQFDKLTSWTARNEPGIKYYSGTAVYAKRFDLNAKALASGKKIVLDLGGLKNVATVRLNGKQLGVLWTAPWRVDATGAIKPTDNLLEIDVVNLWANRVIGDLNLPKEKRLTKTHDEFRFDFISKNTGLLDSGLLGPVMLKTAE